MKKYKKEDSSSYTLGMTLTIELLKTMPQAAKAVYLHPEINRNEAYALLTELCRKHGVPVHEDGIKPFNILSQKENCFAIGEFTKFYSDLDTARQHVLLVNPSNAGNLGTILRSCRGFGIKDIAVISPAADIFDPKVVRASMGAIFGVRIKYFSSFDEYSALFSDHSFYPFMLDAATMLHETSFKRPFSLIFGNEATGLPPEFAGIGSRVIIRQSPEIDSLNLPVAVSIALYEATRGYPLD